MVKRGNGWAIAALAEVLQVLPQSSPHRAGYEADFWQVAARLAWVQRQDGFWNVNLGDPNNCPEPETSGTAFFTYGLAWGRQPSDHQPVRAGDTSNFAVGAFPLATSDVARLGGRQAVRTPDHEDATL